MFRVKLLLVAGVGVLFSAFLVIAFRQQLQNAFFANLSRFGTAQLHLQVVQDVPLTGTASRFDYQAVDAEHHRLYIAHENDDRVTVVDTQERRVIGDVTDIAYPHGVILIPQLKRVYATAEGTNEVVVFDAETLKILNRVAIGKIPDGLTYDPNSNQIFVSTEGEDAVSVMNVATNKFVTRIPVGKRVGNSHYDDVSKHVFTTVGNENALVEIDPVHNQMIGKYDMTGCDHPHGFAIASFNHTAYVTCEHNNVMLVFDLNSKKILQKESVGFTPDVVDFDPGTKKLYVGSESGIVAIFEASDTGVKKLGWNFLVRHAHSVAVNPMTHELYVPVDDLDGKPALRIFKPL